MQKITLVFASLLLLAGPLPAAEVPVNMKPVRVSEHVWFVQGVAGIATENAGFVSNAGFVITPGGIVVFDALGTPALAHKLLGLIRQLSDAPIRKVVVSHYHADHILGLQVFKEQGAEIIAAAGALEYLSSDVSASRLNERRGSLAPWVDDNTRLVPPDQVIEADTEFELGGIGFRIHFLGNAHSEGDLALFVDSDRVLFSGDIIFEGRIPFLGAANTRNWLNSLQRMREQQVSAIVPGHGPMAKDPVKLVRLTHDYLEYLRRHMGAAVENFEAFDEAYEGVDWSPFWEYPAFAEANRRNAYQVFLSMEQESLQGN